VVAIFAPSLEAILPGYRTWATNDIPSAADWNELHADPIQGDVAADESTTDVSYVNLGTVGPTATKTLVAGQKVIVWLSTWMDTSTDTAHGRMSFEVTGASTLAAADANAAHWFAVKTQLSTGGTVFRSTVYTATNSGSHVFRCRYRSDGSATMHFADRRIIIKSF
jgi:hypothetical protein